MLCKYLLGQGKFKFCFVELSGIFFQIIFNLRLVEFVNVEPTDMEGQLHI